MLVIHGKDAQGEGHEPLQMSREENYTWPGFGMADDIAEMSCQYTWQKNPDVIDQVEWAWNNIMEGRWFR